MKKPKELIGKVRKFEDWYIRSISGMAGLPVQKTENILNFYTQPFKPEMIEDYFNVKRIGISTFLMPNKKVFEVYRLDDEFVMNNIQGLELLIPTLSDFIDACLNSNIELEWK